MYRYALTYGYRTAFLNNDPIGSIYENGRTTANQINNILSFWHESQVVCVGHSKGGLDIQGAIMYHNMAPYILRVITLGTPHWGTPLANLAYDPLLSKLPTLQRNIKQSPALKDLTTSSMATFRQQYDQNPTYNSVPFFTLNGVGSEGNKALFNGEGKAFLNAIDTQNDDLVIASYALKPNSTNIATLNAYHSQLNDGYIVWNVIEPYIKGTNTTGMITPSNYTVRLDQTVFVGAVTSAALYPVSNALSTAFQPLTNAVSNAFTNAFKGPDARKAADVLKSALHIHI